MATPQTPPDDSPPGAPPPDPAGAGRADVPGTGGVPDRHGVYAHDPGHCVTCSDRPTIGAVRRNRGVVGWSDEGRVFFCVVLVEEARRRAVMERLDGIMHFLAVGATADQAAARLAQVLYDIDPQWSSSAREAA